MILYPILTLSLRNFLGNCDWALLGTRSFHIYHSKISEEVTTEDCFVIVPSISITFETLKEAATELLGNRSFPMYHYASFEEATTEDCSVIVLSICMIYC